MNPESIADYLSSKGIAYVRRNGQLQTRCVFSGCDDGRKNLNDTHLYFDEKEGRYLCHKCGEKGNLITLKKHFGDPVEKQHFTTVGPLNQVMQKRPETPRKSFDPMTVLGTKQALPDNITQYLVKRGISEEIINKRDLGYAKIYDKNWISIPIKDQLGKYVYLKLREDPATGKDKRMYPFGEPQLYPWENLKDAKELTICEGEMDEMVLASNGINAVTSTHGAKNFKEEWLQAFPRLEKLTLCFDNDQAGIEGRDKILKWLAKSPIPEIYVIDIPPEVGKDVTDYFAKHGKEDFLNLMRLLPNDARMTPIQEVAFDLELHRGQRDHFPIGFEPFNSTMEGGVTDGDLIVISGPSGHGKTTFAQTINYHLAQVGLPSAWFSYEIPIDQLWKKFQAMGLSKEFLAYTPRKLTSGNVGWLKGRIMEAIYRYNVKAIFIDHLGFLAPEVTEENAREFDRNFSAYLGQLTRQLKSIAMENDVIVFLLAHTRKSAEELTIEDIAHSIGIAQESDFVFMVERLKNKPSSKSKWADQSPESGTTFSPYSKISMVKNRRTGQNKFVKVELKDGRLQDLPPQAQIVDYFK